MNSIANALLALLPYFTIPEGHLGPLPIHPFGLLVATGVIIGHNIATRRAKVLGLDERKFENLVFATVATGFVLSHVFDSIAYHPAQIAEDPLYIIEVWKGLSSFGGFFGAAIGFAIYARMNRIDTPKKGGVLNKNRTDLWRSADAIAYGLPVGWFFGRMGCSVVHDHPGKPSTSPFAVNFPAHLGGPHFDLGVLELMLTPILIAIAFYVGHRTKRPGAVVGTLAVVYPFIRFPLDYLRVGDSEGGDVRYFGFTPGQYACIGLFLLGAWILWHTSKLKTDEPSASAAQPGDGKKGAKKSAAANA